MQTSNNRETPGWEEVAKALGMEKPKLWTRADGQSGSVLMIPVKMAMQTARTLPYAIFHPRLPSFMVTRGIWNPGSNDR